MMEKRLKKYTSIPEHLYVRRSADEQLKRIVDEMQRPGYVLVARQMGKTNLLFNAKRTLENENRLFVYVDLSNVFEIERDCYRNIIDSIVEPNQALFEAIEQDIIDLRTKEFPAHKEYSKSLAIVLKSFLGNVVIVLDEIDALRSASYSDNIFAQIRSNYFSRTNFPVFERLTYILSGVIEPTELIKDRNKSPFNIGDKIYLDDFTFEEHRTFLDKSGLSVSEEISDRIYYWTQGNPRLTFDVCSSLEDSIIQKEEINLSHLDGLIKRKYLTSYDIAPIDHIRELVKSNKRIRNAVNNIHKGKITDLTDEVKKKLYLFGIINSKFGEKITIKNPIVADSLSMDWIKSIDLSTQDSFSYALDKMDQLEFREAIDSFDEFLNNSTPTASQQEICNYNIGFAWYNLKELKNAIDYFSREYNTDLFKHNSKSLLGICKLGVGLKEEGVQLLEEVIGLKPSGFAYRNALLNLAPIVSETDKDRALELYNLLLESVNRDNGETKVEELDKIRTLALYYKAEIYYEKDDLLKTIETLDKALEFSEISDSLHLRYSKYIISEQAAEGFVTKLIDTIISNDLRFERGSVYPISFTEDHLFEYLELSFDKNNLEDYKKLLDYSNDYLFSQRRNKFDIAYSSSIHSDKRIDILNFIQQNDEDVSRSIALKVNRDLAFHESSNRNKFFEYFKEYQALFLEQKEIIDRDIYLYALAIKHMSDEKRLEKGIELCDIISDKIQKANDEVLNFESVIIFYWYANLSFSMKNKELSIHYANKTIELVKDSAEKRTSMIDEKGLQSIVEQMNQIKTSSIIRKPVLKQKKYGRNEKVRVKYLDGTITENKYKMLEADILSERCVIIKNG